MSDEDFPVETDETFCGQKGVEIRKNKLKTNQAGKGRRHPENIFPLRTYRDWRAAAKTVKWMSKYCVKKNYVFVDFSLQKNIYIYNKNCNLESNYRIRKENVCRDFSAYAFWNNVRLYRSGRNGDKNSEKRALFSIKCSRGAISIVDKIENWKKKRKKTTSVDEKEKDEVKLHAALVLNMTYWVIYEPRRDT